MEAFARVLGARGSVAVSGQAYRRYGGATSCIFLRLCGQAVVLDAGTGMLSLHSLLCKADEEIPVLLSHPHADHLIGLPLSPLAMDPSRNIVIYATVKQGLGPKEQLAALMSPPLWPVLPEQLPAAISYQTINSDFSLGSIQVRHRDGAHPGGATLFRLTGGGKTVVYIPDCNLQDLDEEEITEFAKDCDLLLCDGQYSPEEWETYRSFGHSTWEMAANLGARCGAGQTRILHHDPTRTDTALDAAAVWLQARYPNCTFAYEGEVIHL